MDGLEQVKVLRERILADCRPDKAFWTCNGAVIRNMYELASCIWGLNECAFCYHVNDDHRKNDFAKWVGDVLEDYELAGRLEKIRDKTKYVQVIRERIKELELVK